MALIGIIQSKAMFHSLRLLYTGLKIRFHCIPVKRQIHQFKIWFRGINCLKTLVFQVLRVRQKTQFLFGRQNNSPFLPFSLLSLIHSPSNKLE